MCFLSEIAYGSYEFNTGALNTGRPRIPFVSDVRIPRCLRSRILRGDSGLKKCNTIQWSLFECQCIWHESTNWRHYSYVSYWRRDRHFTWSCKLREGLAICRAKGVPLFLSHFKTLSVGPVLRIEPATTRSAVKRSTDWAHPCLGFYLFPLFFFSI